MIVIGTINGSLHGFDAKSGRAEWTIESWGPVANTQEMFDPEDSPHLHTASSEGESEHGEPEHAAEDAALESPSTELQPSSDSRLSEAEDPDERPLLIPSYEAGGGLWFFWPSSQALQKLPFTVNKIVEESPMMDQGYVFHGKKVVKLMALDPVRGRIRWIHDDDGEPGPKAGRARSRAAAPEEVLLISRAEYTLFTTNARTGRLRSSVSISDLSLLGAADEAADARALPLIVAEEDAGGEQFCEDGL